MSPFKYQLTNGLDQGDLILCLRVPKAQDYHEIRQDNMLRWLIIEFNKTQMTHKRRLIKAINNLLDLIGIYLMYYINY